MPKNIKCKHCDKLKNHWCRAVIDSPDEDMVRDCRYFHHKTNADLIRSMADEELAMFLGRVKEPCDHCQLSVVEGACTETLCDDAMMKWLKQPVED